MRMINLNGGHHGIETIRWRIIDKHLFRKIR